ncbi:CIC11C00000005219 [Sungouiella intermedia]|uniref:CIC11C00000005219 n=1 Tax=Sungouiella intermedia TaxID=45354 RepID=A0A1L0BK62_9ASCO|nr:CIC11C00000005219 [[Candida] intermedia]
MVSSHNSGRYSKLESKLDTVSESEMDAGCETTEFLPKDSETLWEGAEVASVESNTPSVAYEDAEESSPYIEGSSSNLAFTGESNSTSENRHGSDPVTAPSADLESQLLNGLGLSARQRALNVIQYIFPVRQTYERLSNGIATGRMQANTPGRFVGQGTDGVFRNLMAKPDTEDNRITQEQHPPTYEEAAADATPEYWETTMISPMYEDEVFVQGLPVGNVANFVWNVLVTVAFQLIGFILCYLLHTSHAAKQGTRGGLGITLVMYGYSIIPANFGHSDRIPIKFVPDEPNLIDISALTSIKGEHFDTYLLGLHLNDDTSTLLAATKKPYFAYGLIALGIFIIIKSIVDFYKVKQVEKLILAPQRAQEVHTVTDNVNEHEGP